MFGLIRKKKIIEQIAYLDVNIDKWKDIWKDAKDENVRVTVLNTLDNIHNLVLEAARFVDKS